MATAPLNFLTPSGVVQCRATQLLWSGGSPPYSVTAIGAQNSLNSPTLGVVGSFRTLRAAYRVAIPGGTLIKFRVVDSSTPPQVADTNLISVGESEIDSCLPASQQTRTRSSTASSGTPAAQTPSPSSSLTTSTPSQTRDLTTTPGASVSSPRSVASRSVSTGIGSLGSSSSATDDAQLGSSTNLANSNERRHTSISPAFFGAAAGVAILLILVIAGWCMWNKRRQRNTQAAEEDWFAVPNHHQADVKVPENIAMNTIGAQHKQRWTGIADSSTEQLMPGSRAVSMYPGHQSFAVSTEHDADHASLYAARAQEYYPADMKRSFNIMSAPDADEIHGEASALPYATSASSSAPPQTTGQVTAADPREKPLPIPTNLSEEEMSRLADLVASRMREKSDPQEPPPSYQ